jgi:hypothetical protein
MLVWILLKHCFPNLPFANEKSSIMEEVGFTLKHDNNFKAIRSGTCTVITPSGRGHEFRGHYPDAMGSLRS